MLGPLSTRLDLDSPPDYLALTMVACTDAASVPEVSRGGPLVGGMPKKRKKKKAIV